MSQQPSESPRARGTARRGSISQRRAPPPRSPVALALKVLLFLVVVGGLAGGAWWMRARQVQEALEGLTACIPPEPSTATFDDLPQETRRLILRVTEKGAASVPSLTERYGIAATPGERAAILHALGQLGGSTALHHLMSVVNSGAGPEAETAAACVGRFGGTTALLRVSELAGSPDPSLQHLAVTLVQALPLDDAPRGAEALLPLRGSQDADLRLRVLGATRPMPMEVQETWRFYVECLVAAEPTLSDGALRELQARTAEFSKVHRYHEQVAHLRRQAKAERPLHVRLNVRRFLRALGAEAAIVLGREDLSSTTPEIVCEAAITLRELGDHSSVPRLLEAMRTSHPPATRELARALGSLGRRGGRAASGDLIEQLQELVGQGGPTGSGACLALALLRSADSLELVYTAFVGAGAGVEAQLTHEALVELAGKDLGPTPTAWSKWWRREKRILELRIEIRRLQDQADVIVKEDERGRYSEALAHVEQALEKLAELGRLTARTYTSWSTELTALLDFLHKNTTIDLDEEYGEE